MFADLILIPSVRKDREREFRRWYSWSVGYAKQLGFAERSLLKERDGLGYAIIDEHESYDRLLAMLNHPFRQMAQRRVAPLLEGEAASGSYYTMLNRGSSRKSMFVSVVFFPPVREEKDAEFRKWFWQSSDFCAGRRDCRRRLLWPLQGGNYAAVLEYDGQKDTPNAPAGCSLPLFDGEPPILRLRATLLLTACAPALAAPAAIRYRASCCRAFFPSSCPCWC